MGYKGSKPKVSASKLFCRSRRPRSFVRPAGRYVSCDCPLDHHDLECSTGFSFRKENIREIHGRGETPVVIILSRR